VIVVKSGGKTAALQLRRGVIEAVPLFA